ncbi:MAG: hypothetical protein NC935_06290 [Candidatus Omnitrophica bacterium]|nr:hypothetical protein [Candidatus Omnitrophota bacterium]
MYNPCQKHKFIQKNDGFFVCEECGLESDIPNFYHESSEPDFILGSQILLSKWTQGHKLIKKLAINQGFDFNLHQKSDRYMYQQLNDLLPYFKLEDFSKIIFAIVKHIRQKVKSSRLKNIIAAAIILFYRQRKIPISSSEVINRLNKNNIQISTHSVLNILYKTKTLATGEQVPVKTLFYDLLFKLFNNEKFNEKINAISKINKKTLKETIISVFNKIDHNKISQRVSTVVSIIYIIIKKIDKRLVTFPILAEISGRNEYTLREIVRTDTTLNKQISSLLNI